MEKWTVLDTLRHARHDWLNKVQLLKGNLALGKIDQVERILEEIIIEARQESKLTNLKAPKLAEMILTFNWKSPPFLIEYEILQEGLSLSSYDLILSKWVQSLLDILSVHVSTEHNNHLYIGIDGVKDTLQLTFEFNGKLLEENKLKVWFNQDYNHLNISNWDETHFLCTKKVNAVFDK